MHSKSMSRRIHFRLIRFTVGCPDYPHAVTCGASNRYSSSSSIMVYASGLWLACREVSPRLSPATAATPGVLHFRWFDLPPGILNNFLLMVLTRISFWQCFYLWLDMVELVHCPFTFRSSTIFWSIPVCASAQTWWIIFCPGTTFPFSTFSTFFFAWYTLFSLAVHLGCFVVVALMGSSGYLFPPEFASEKLLSLRVFHSWKSSSSRTGCRRASIQCLSSAYSWCFDMCRTASSSI